MSNQNWGINYDVLFDWLKVVSISTGIVLFSIHWKKGFVFIASDSGKGPMAFIIIILMEWEVKDECVDE